MFRPLNTCRLFSYTFNKNAFKTSSLFNVTDQSLILNRNREFVFNMNSRLFSLVKKNQSHIFKIDSRMFNSDQKYQSSIFNSDQKYQSSIFKIDPRFFNSDQKYQSSIFKIDPRFFNSDQNNRKSIPKINSDQPYQSLGFKSNKFTITQKIMIAYLSIGCGLGILMLLSAIVDVNSKLNDEDPDISFKAREIMFNGIFFSPLIVIAMAVIWPCIIYIIFSPQR
jgi:hypothetical protein